MGRMEDILIHETLKQTISNQPITMRSKRLTTTAAAQKLNKESTISICASWSTTIILWVLSDALNGRFYRRVPAILAADC